MRSQATLSPAGRRRLTRRGGSAFAALAAVSAFSVAGCSGGIANQGNGGSTAAATTAASCGSTIKIGAALPFSGPLQEFGTNSYRGAQVAVDEINAAGGIKSLGGAKLTLVKGDVSSFDTGQATSATTQLIQQGVVALTGAWLSAQTTPVSAVAQSSKVPLVSQSWADALSANGNAYYFQPPARSSALGTQGVKLMIDAAKAAGITFHKAEVILPNDVANQTQGNALVKAFNKAGISTPAATFYTAGLTDATPIVSKVRADKPDLIVTGGSPADSILIVKALRSAGITTPLSSVGGGFAEASFARALGPAVNGIMDITVWNDDLPLAGVAAATKAYESDYKTTFFPVEAGETWVAVQDIAAGLEKAASCSPTALATALHSIDLTSGPGSAMPGGGVYFGTAGYNQKAEPILIQWQNNVPVTIGPAGLKQATFKPAG